MEKIMAVYDVDVRYARRFADVVNQKERTPFSVIPFSTFERLKEYGQTHEIEILLISLSVPQNRIREIPNFWRRSIATSASTSWNPTLRQDRGECTRNRFCNRSRTRGTPRW